jgi:hypothetical protein
VQVERRRSPRYSFSASAEVVDEKENVRTSSQVCDLSLQGCYLEMQNPFPQGTTATVEIYTEEDFLEAHATVAYREPGHGMGLKFDGIQPHFVNVLKKWLTRSESTQKVQKAAAGRQKRFS